MGGILLAVEKVQNYFADVLEAAVVTAIGYDYDFPFTPEHKALLAGHIRQRSELHAFVAARV